MSSPSLRRPPAWSAYLHWPWCRSRCAYCAFNVSTAAPEAERWLAGIAAGWAVAQPHFPGRATAVYLGGGTPSLAAPATVARALSLIPHDADAECTLEANPGTVDLDGLARLRDAGINRLSLGVQTFDPAHARRLSRGHTVKAAHRLLADVHTVGFASWSADLIFSLPGQTLDELAADLATLLAHAPPHVSIYSLSYEPGTPLRRALDAGRLVPVEDELWADQYALVVDTLESAGLERYEVSNFARPGHRGRHNERVWRGAHYLGLGPGAHGFRPDGRRTLGAAALADWLAEPAGATESPDPEAAAIDLVLSTLRHVDGLPLALLAARCGATVDRERLGPLFDRGLLHAREGDRGPHLVLDRSAFPIADAVVARVCDAVRQGTNPAGGESARQRDHS